jgi:DNA-binding NtrC family response regulator
VRPRTITVGRAALEEIEAEAIRFAITHYGGRMSEVALRLRIGRPTLYRKLD